MFQNGDNVNATATLYGLKNCDSCRRARQWLEAHGITPRLHDVRADGLDASRLERWVQALGWERLLNRRSTTWRQLGDARPETLDAESAARLILEHPTLLRRPVLESGARLLVGFSSDDYRQHLLAE